MKAALFFSALTAGLLLGACRAEPAFEDELLENIERINEKCPAMLDTETRIDGISRVNDSTIRYNYTLVNATAGVVDTAQFRRAMWPGLLSMVKLSADMRFLREHNTVIQYSYADKHKVNISILSIHPRHYNQP